MGQFIQEGSRILFETVVDIAAPQQDLYIQPDPNNFDGLNFLSDQNMSVVNRKAMCTIPAHTGGRRPQRCSCSFPPSTRRSWGILIYFEKACAHPIPVGTTPKPAAGVESYKKICSFCWAKLAMRD